MDKILSMLGLAARAGRTVSGEDMVLEAVRGRKARLVIMASDVSERSSKMYSDKCAYYHVPCYTYSGKEELGHAIGKDERSAVAITDRGMSDAVIKLLDSFNGGK